MAASPEPQKRELSRPVTVALASVGSVVAAIVVSKIWGPGTLIGAAATPVIITLVAEALRKPVETVAVRTPTGTAVHDVGAPRPRAGEAPTTVTAPGRARPAGSRRGLKVALVTGLIAFVIGAFVLTSTELIFGDSAASGAKTTLFSKSPSSSSAKERAKERTTTTTTTETTPPPTSSTGTGTGVAPAPTTPEEETPTFTEEAPAAPAPGATGATGATLP